MSKIIAIVNQKGGVGKTTTTFNMGAALAQQGKTVLLLDFDPQGNLSSYSGYESDSLPTMSDIITYTIENIINIYTSENAGEDNVVSAEKYYTSSIRKNMVEGFDYIPSTIILSGAEQLLMNAICRESVLSKVLSYLKTKYDYILIDCPPSLGILSINALTASDEIIIPVQAQNFALDGLMQLIETIKRVQTLNTELKINGFILTMVNRTNMSSSVSEALRGAFGQLVYETYISESTKAPDSTLTKESIKGKLGDQYKAVVNELLDKSI